MKRKEKNITQLLITLNTLNTLNIIKKVTNLKKTRNESLENKVEVNYTKRGWIKVK